ncbi:phage tail protein [Hymenobacter baengnokdamensis]|uniref:phage tail protein n=1 Tax=Hymenobacter baengnokdamensis TaxID=2615203 RepID=UPI00124675B8|nr:tail fiber protein [Hymenobacter baengnokdamensis]
MDPFVGEIRLMPYTFAPQGWFTCSGQLLAIQQYTALFSLLGTQYGGNGTSTFALPDLRGRACIGAGQGPGLQSYPQGTATGTESVTLLAAEMPVHTHGVSAAVPVNTGRGTAPSPLNGYFAKTASEEYGSTADNGSMAAGVVTGTASPAGSSQPHDNRMPYLPLNYCIAWQGVFPQRQ